ncbi:MAG: hypothetical protein R3B82_12455, partial [Sandaracinaceae bacterium]
DAGGADAGGECAAGCDDGLDCTADACEAGACVHTPDDARCTDGSAGTCVVGFGCQYAGCTPDTCVAGPCEVAHCAGDSCVIESACGATEECCGGTCVPAGCDDRDPCTDDTCGGAACTHTPNTATCDDGVFCNGADTCGGGTCSTHAGDPCSGASVCDETSGSCVGCVGDADCPDPVAGSWGSCGYADVCAQTGTQERTVTSYRCMGGSCRATPSMESRACSRSTNGNSCGSTTFGTWGSCGGFSGTCDESGTRSRSRMDRVCASGSCTTQSSTDTGACARDTDGTMCAATAYGTWGSCGGFSDTCDESGTRSRSQTDYACVAGTCASTVSTDTGACSRSTTGTSCGATTFGSWGSCGGYSDTCDETGTQSRTRTDFACSGGACDSTMTMESQGCGRTTTGTACGTPTYTVWSACGGFSTECDESGTQSRTRTDYTCGGGTCSVGTNTPESQACARDTDGNFCENWVTCRTGSCVAGACNAPGSCSGRCCEPNICVSMGSSCP